MKNKSVLITGSSTGIGREAALYFQKQGWNVAASMRTPGKESELTKLPNVICPQIDVTNPESIEKGIAQALQTFGSLDAVVNNAGYGLTGPFEGASEEQIKRQFDTNVFGLMKVTRAILPHFREQKSGTPINVASVGGRLVFPLYSLYHSTKWAIDGFSESLRFELEPLGIRVKIIEPGPIKTDFFSRSNDSTVATAPSEYSEMCRVGFANMNKVAEQGTEPIEVAKAIFKAATDGSSRIRYVVGTDAKSLLFLRKFLSDGAYAKLTRTVVFRN